MSENITVGNISFNLKSGADIVNSLKNGEYRLQVVVYGPPGCGKSRFAATFPYKCGVIDTDGGALAYAKSIHDVVTITYDEKGQGARPHAFNEAMAAITYFLSKPEYKGIIIDSTTTIGDACMNYVLLQNNRYNSIPTLPERNAALETMKALLSKAQNSQKHLIVIAHERIDKDEVTGKIWCRPAVAGQYSSAMPVYFDEVYHGQPRRTAKGIEYRFDTRSDSMYPCKSRLDTIVPIGESIEPDFSLIMKKVEALHVD